ncbi:MAG: DegV family EDD domain-containing protein [Candidatus Cloacimonetes bacterium]|nr:DegV family EDD domain-containing protein [Candidatus Cloacimonadota bacterium]
MAILYLDGRRLFRGFIAGSRSVTAWTDYLNKINVFPVPDGDTGANLSATLANILQSSKPDMSLKSTAENLAEHALSMARGNSGIIFAQFLYGLSQELPQGKRLTIADFSRAAHKAVDYMYEALTNPVEGTMITVIRVWAESMLQFSGEYNDLFQVFKKSLLKARISLEQTPRQLEVLRKAGVVDAGGKGFVVFLEGISEYLEDGNLLEQDSHQEQVLLGDIREHQGSRLRFCCETLLTKLQQEPRQVIKELETLGDSIASAGGRNRLHLHIHTNEPTAVFHILAQHASISNVKVDDMIWQQQIQENRKFKIGLVTDSAADFPDELRQYYQVNTIPIKLMFGEDIYLDKVTINSEQFFNKIEAGSVFPRSSQPDPAQVNATLDFVRTHFEKVICLSISSQLSGVYNLMNLSAGNNEDVAVFDSRHLSVSQGLLVLRVAESIKEGMPFEEIIKNLPEWREGCWIFTDIRSLDFMVRGGRVSPITGKIAKLLNLKPIVSVDEQGKGIAWGKSFSRKSNMKKIIGLVQEKAGSGKLWNYAIVHARCNDRAARYGELLGQKLGKAPLYIMDIGPVVGVHNGPGACAVGLLVEKE